MAEYFLTIFPSGGRAFDVALTTNLAQDGIDDKFVFNAMHYQFKLNIGGVDTVRVYVNGEFVESSNSGGNIHFRRDMIFLDCYGYARLDFVINGNLKLRSKYLPVRVRKDEFNKSVKAMVRYIYENCEEFLFDGDLKSRELIDINRSRRQTLADRIKLAENIAAVYEKNYSYFKVNARFKTDKIATLDDFEKLQSVTPAALRYIAAHPENLTQAKSAVGIRVGSRVFHPRKTLTLKNNISRDTYENAVTLGFITKIIDDLGSFSVALGRNYRQENYQPDDEYEDSTRYLFYWADLAIEKISVLREKFRRLLKLYAEALQLTPPANLSAPKPTPIFLSVPQYNQIFLCIHEWLNFGVYDFAKENFMFAIAKNWNLYEKYLLLKFIAYLRTDGYRLIGKLRLNYRLPPGSLYTQTNILNTFIFTNGANRVTIYYQPVIGDNPVKFSEVAPGLYRNNSIIGAGGSYYVPDFAVKIENLNKDNDALFGNFSTVQYLIIDAKFSDARNVYSRHLPEIILKYVFSISTINLGDKISGYSIVYGKCSSREKPVSAYDKQHPRNKIIPSFELVPFMENVGNENLSLYKILTL